MRMEEIKILKLLRILGRMTLKIKKNYDKVKDQVFVFGIEDISELTNEWKIQLRIIVKSTEKLQKLEFGLMQPMMAPEVLRIQKNFHYMAKEQRNKCLQKDGAVLIIIGKKIIARTGFMDVIQEMTQNMMFGSVLSLE